MKDLVQMLAEVSVQSTTEEHEQLMKNKYVNLEKSQAWRRDDPNAPLHILKKKKSK